MPGSAPFVRFGRGDGAFPELLSAADAAAADGDDANVPAWAAPLVSSRVAAAAADDEGGARPEDARLRMIREEDSASQLPTAHVADGGPPYCTGPPPSRAVPRVESLDLTGEQLYRSARGLPAELRARVWREMAAIVDFGSPSAPLRAATTTAGAAPPAAAVGSGTATASALTSASAVRQKGWLAQEAVPVLAPSTSHRGLLLGSAADATDVPQLAKKGVVAVLNLCGRQRVFARGAFGEIQQRELSPATYGRGRLRSDAAEADVPLPFPDAVVPIRYVEVHDLADWEAHTPLRFLDHLLELLTGPAADDDDDDDDDDGTTTSRTSAVANGATASRLRGNVLVHCQAGMNRSAVLAVAAVMLLRQVPLLGALRDVAAARGCVLSTEGFRWQLMGLAAKLDQAAYLERDLPELLSTAEAMRDLVETPLPDLLPAHSAAAFPQTPWPEDRKRPLADGTTQKLQEADLLDPAKARQNRLRKDHDPGLIQQNEEEAALLEFGLFNEVLRGALRGTWAKKVRLLPPSVFMFAQADVDAVVCTANECLQGGGGTDLMTHTYAGPTLAEETRELPAVQGEADLATGAYRCLTGEAVVTRGHHLAAPYIVHVVTPYRDEAGKTQDLVLARCVQNVLRYVNGSPVKTISMGPISTGYYGFPMLPAAVWQLRAIKQTLETRGDDVERIDLWLYNDLQHALFAHVLELSKPDSP